VGSPATRPPRWHQIELQRCYDPIKPHPRYVHWDLPRDLRAVRCKARRVYTRDSATFIRRQTTSSMKLLPSLLSLNENLPHPLTPLRSWDPFARWKRSYRIAHLHLAFGRATLGISSSLNERTNELYLAFSAISDIKYESPSHCFIPSKELYILTFAKHAFCVFRLVPSWSSKVQDDISCLVLAYYYKFII